MHKKVTQISYMCINHGDKIIVLNSLSNNKENIRNGQWPHTYTIQSNDKLLQSVFVAKARLYKVFVKFAHNFHTKEKPVTPNTSSCQVMAFQYSHYMRLAKTTQRYKHTYAWASEVFFPWGTTSRYLRKFF